MERDTVKPATTHARIGLDQHKVLKDAAGRRGVSFQCLLRRALRVGIKVMRLEETK